MTDAFKELVKNAPLRTSGLFYRFMFASNGIYDGFWGKNGYDNIILLGQAADDETWYRIASEIDVLQVYRIGANGMVSVDIPSEYGVPCLFFDKPLRVNYNGLTSALMINHQGDFI